MKHLIYIIPLISLLFACGSPKQAIESGDFDKAVYDASLALKKNPDNEKQILYLKEAFSKATKRDLALIDKLEASAETNPKDWLTVFDIYDKMLIREIAVAPLLPLYVKGKEVYFDVPDVTNAAEVAKINASKSVYANASELLADGTKASAREAYVLFDKLIEFNFNYRDARALRDEARLKGSINVFVQMKNNTGKRLPDNFESDLLTIRDGSFTNEWIRYAKKKTAGIAYDYEIDLDITQLEIGRDREEQRQYREQQQVVIGYKQGRDSNGNAVRIPQYGYVYADVIETMQSKPILVAGEVTYKELPTGKVLATLPVEREEAWQNNYARFRGDERALSQETIQKIQAGKQPFPQDEEFLNLSGKLLNQVLVQLFEENAGNLTE